MPQYIFVETLTVTNVNGAYAYTIAKNSPLVKAMVHNSELPPKTHEVLSSAPKVTFDPAIVELFTAEWNEADFFGRVGMFLLAMDNFDQPLMRSVMRLLRTMHPSVNRFIHLNSEHLERYRLGSIHE